MNFLDREIHRLACRVAVCVNERQFKATIKKLGVTCEDGKWLNSWHANATLHRWERPDIGDVIAIVCVGKSIGQVEMDALLVHEAVHIWQWHLKLIGERKPSAEFEAYGIQSISQKLMFAYRELMAKERKKKKPTKRLTKTQKSAIL